MNVTIATFNLKSDRLMSGANRWKHRRERLAAVLHSLGADITAVQELTPRMKRDLAEAFPARFLGEGRAGLFDEHTDIAVTSRVNVCRHRTFPLPTGALSVVFPRICTAAELAVAQWASAFAERGLGISKTLGDLCGPLFFGVLMGLGRVFYAKFSDRLNLEKFKT